MSELAPSAPRRPWVVGISGASGTPYALSAIGGLLDAGEPVDLVVSRAARLTILDETGISFRDAHWREDLAALLDWKSADPRLDAVRYCHAGDFAAGLGADRALAEVRVVGDEGLLQEGLVHFAAELGLVELDLLDLLAALVVNRDFNHGCLSVVSGQ